MRSLSMITAPPCQPMRLVGCGILHKEVDHLIRKNGWPLEAHYLDSTLHNHLDRLSSQLNQALDQETQQQHDTIVFYGCCHPRMENYLDHHHTLRTQGQNCIVMLLGHERFVEELEEGSYFLLEDWALCWRPMLASVFGTNRSVVQEIFHASHKRIVAVQTSCSGDFRHEAQAAADYLALPLRWMHVSLDHLETVLMEAIARKAADQTERMPHG
ncbi:MAG: DUF1638 domain-containing protein [Magnetococcales bacterium]|nr:DUF1638 domain-containing protein [Magnetococcales bacterium]